MITHAERFEKVMRTVLQDPTARGELSTPEGRLGWLGELATRPVSNSRDKEHRTWIAENREECEAILERLTREYHPVT
jgi:hypothetical protein